MFTIFTEFEIYQEICFFDDYPNWKNIIANHTDIYLNIDDHKLEVELNDPDSLIFSFMNAYVGAKLPVAFREYFNSIKKDMSKILNHSTSTFILDIQEKEAQEARDNYGVAVFSDRKLVDDYFMQGYFKETQKDEKFKNGWKSLINIELPVSNALIISDNFLFENTERKINCGLANIPNLIDVFLPQKLSVDFHLTIMAPNGGKSHGWWVEKAAELKGQISRLRSYNINFELVLTNSIHKRKIVSNYINGWADNGFSIFRSYDHETARHKNDIHLYRIFHNLNPSGDSHCKSLHTTLSDLKSICKTVSDFIANFGECDTHMIFGDYNQDKKIKNRLLN